MPSRPPPTAADLQQALARLAGNVAERHRGTQELLLAGIASGGVPVARRLALLLEAAWGRKVPVGSVNIAFHRDDLWANPIPKDLAPTDLPLPVDGRVVLLVDDVLFSGRTVRAALNELFDEGRPARVELAVLVDRGGRSLPFQPDFAGLVVEGLGPGDKLVVQLDPEDPARDRVELVTAAP